MRSYFFFFFSPSFLVFPLYFAKLGICFSTTFKTTYPELFQVKKIFSEDSVISGVSPINSVITVMEMAGFGLTISRPPVNQVLWQLELFHSVHISRSGIGASSWHTPLVTGNPHQFRTPEGIPAPQSLQRQGNWEQRSHCFMVGPIVYMYVYSHHFSYWFFYIFDDFLPSIFSNVGTEHSG